MKHTTDQKEETQETPYILFLSQGDLLKRGPTRKGAYSKGDLLERGLF